VKGDQAAQRRDHALLDPLAREQRPPLERLAIATGEAFQKWAAVQFDCRFEVADRALDRLAARSGFARCISQGLLPLARGEVLLEAADVGAEVGERIDLDRITADQKERRAYVLIMNRLAQLGKGEAKVAECSAIGPIRPQERSQYRSGVWPAGLDGQISEQAAHLARIEVGNGPAIETCLVRAQ